MMTAACCNATNMSWILDELEHAGAEHLDAGQVALYDAKAQFDAEPEVRLLQSLGLNEAQTLIDLGAGPGELALEAARVCRRVIAVDVSPAMLNVIRDKATRRDVGNVEVVQGGFLGYQHEGEQADFVYSRNALHHLPDFWKVQALRRVHRMLKPGGVLRLRDLAFSFEADESKERIEGWLAHSDQMSSPGYPRSELETHVCEEFSTFTWLLEVMLERVGFAVEQTQYSPSGIFIEYVCRSA